MYTNCAKSAQSSRPFFFSKEKNFDSNLEYFFNIGAVPHRVRTLAEFAPKRREAELKRWICTDTNTSWFASLSDSVFSPMDDSSRSHWCGLSHFVAPQFTTKKPQSLLCKFHSKITHHPFAPFTTIFWYQFPLKQWKIPVMQRTLNVGTERSVIHG